MIHTIPQPIWLCVAMRPHSLKTSKLKAHHLFHITCGKPAQLLQRGVVATLKVKFVLFLDWLEDTLTFLHPMANSLD